MSLSSHKLRKALRKIAPQPVVDWYMELQEVELFYKGTRPFGAIGVKPPEDDTTDVHTVFCMSRDDTFTVGMFRHLIELRAERSICLVSEDESQFDKVEALLSRYGFICIRQKTLDTGYPMMFSFHFKDKE